MLDYVKAMKENLGYFRHNPQRLRSGKTHYMLEDLISTISKKGTGKFAVIFPTMKQAEDCRKRVIDMLTNDQSIEVCFHSNVEEIVSDQWSIKFLSTENIESKLAGIHPTPLRFVDHTTEERIVSNGVDKIEQAIKKMRGKE